MAKITLNGIMRRGDDWKGAARWSGRGVRIWSEEHHAWWRPASAGYTDNLAFAGQWDFEDAYAMTKHCGPEKKIVFVATE